MVGPAIPAEPTALAPPRTPLNSSSTIDSDKNNTNRQKQKAYDEANTIGATMMLMGSEHKSDRRWWRRCMLQCGGISFVADRTEFEYTYFLVYIYICTRQARRVYKNKIDKDPPAQILIILCDAMMAEVNEQK